MQTFLPYPDFVQSLVSLDYRRLGKQRVEAFQIINIIEKIEENPDQKLAWKNHPARFMWDKHLDALKCYYNLSVLIWLSRGYNNSMKLMDLKLPLLSVSFPLVSEVKLSLSEISVCVEMVAGAEKLISRPAFIGDEEFHRSHQSNLVRKQPEFYGPLFPGVPDDLPYIWPAG